MNTFKHLVAWLITLLIPLALVGSVLRLILIPAYLEIQYRIPNVPPDDYGFSTQDRLHWASYAWDYLVNSSDSTYLADLRFPNGAPVFNEREVSHMHDVKQVIQGSLRLWAVSLALLLVLGIWSWRARWLPAYRRGLRQGGWLTIGLGAVIGTIVGIGVALSPDVFWEFFAWFHSLFFQGTSWLFAFSDTLIRLFPLPFWEDTFLIAAVLVLAGGLALALGVREPPRDPAI